MEQTKNRYYTHKCDRVNRSLAGKEVTVAGWVDTKRDHGSLIFIDLRDSTGLLQCLVDDNEESLAVCDHF
jgi:aspartyl-tRNA synthetase